MNNGVKNTKDLQQEINELKKKLSIERSKNSFTNALLEGGTLIIWAVDRQQHLISFNQNYYNYFLQEYPGKKIGYEKNGITKMVDGSRFWKKKYKHALSGHVDNFEIMIEIEDREKWKEIFLNPIYDTLGQITGVAGLAYDITDKMQSKISLIKNEEKFRNIFESFQDLYFRCDFNGNLTMLSPSAYDIMGYVESELIGKDITNFYIYNIKTKYLLRQLTREKRVRNFEASIVHKSGKIISCICNVRVIQDSKGRLQYIEGVARDITELKKANEELQRSKEVAERLLKIKERFLANMSHEIRTPLNGIMGLLHLMDESHLNNKQRHQVSTIKRSADILLNILNDLLDLSKLEAGKMELNQSPIHTKTLFEKLFLLYQQQANENKITLNHHIDRSLPDCIESDETKLIQIFSNLISNAIKFTPPGGTVTINLDFHKKYNGKIILKGTVTDNGIGISADDQKKLFNSFTQLDSSSSKVYKGTGLGLYISKRIVRLFGGKIGVHSVEGMGSKFWFTFVTKACACPENKIDKTKKELKIDHAPNVLIVDDNIVNRELASEMLRHAGCTVATASSGQEAISKFRSILFNAILMDIQMPDMDGIETAKRIRASSTDTAPPIIAMTAYSMNGDEQKFLQQGMDDYIAKPIDPAVLISKVNYWTSANRDNGAQKKKEKKDNLLTINQNTLDLLKKYAGREGVESALMEFNNECKDQLNDCSKLLTSKNFNEILTILHTLKGNAGTLGIEKLASLAENMEDDLKEKKYFNFEKNLTHLKSLYDDFKKEVKKYFD